jgi:type I restriction enzyme S subunit
MSRIDDLIAEHCPDGVAFKPLGEVITALRAGLNPRENFKLNTSDATGYYVTVIELAGKDIILSSKTDRVSNEALAIIQRRMERLKHITLAFLVAKILIL